VKRFQKTLAQPVSFSGIGLHTGSTVTMTFHPFDKGIVFERVDLPERPRIPALAQYVQDTSRSTNLGTENARIHTVEHVLAALYAMEIDNVLIHVNAAEPPIGDGSSLPFLAMIEEAGVKQLSAEAKIYRLEKPVVYSEGPIHLVALPSDEYRISYTLHYPKSAALRAQYASLVVSKETFPTEIAPCRTFALYDEISALMDRGLIKGGSLENAVVIKDDVVFSKEGLKFPDEMARHKILDLIGDLSLTGVHFTAHIMAIRSGHQANVALAQLLTKELIC
jgi:UDP-3-O-[3-hydroxymyristoyl] N-acetylglucosamine deacetylase